MASKKEQASVRWFPEGGEIRAVAMQDSEFGAAFPWQAKATVEPIVARIRSEFAAGKRAKVGEYRPSRARDAARRDAQFARAMKG